MITLDELKDALDEIVENHVTEKEKCAFILRAAGSLLILDAESNRKNTLSSNHKLHTGNWLLNHAWELNKEAHRK